eukprot:374692-Amphidinium_carterae.1
MSRLSCWVLHGRGLHFWRVTYMEQCWLVWGNEERKIQTGKPERTKENNQETRKKQRSREDSVKDTKRGREK